MTDVHGTHEHVEQLYHMEAYTSLFSKKNLAPSGSSSELFCGNHGLFCPMLEDSASKYNNLCFTNIQCFIYSPEFARFSKIQNIKTS